MLGLWKTLKKSLVDSYDYLGLVLLCSLVWFVVALGSVTLCYTACRSLGFVSLAILVGLYTFLISPTTTGVFFLARKIVTHDDPSLPDMLYGFRRRLLPSWSLALGQLLLTALICTNIWFYLSRPGIPLRLIGVLFVYGLLLWALSAIYHYPMLVEENPGTWRIVKRGFLLTVANPFFTAGVFFVIILLTCFSMLVVVGLPLLYAGLVSVVQTRALRALFVKYELLPPEREYVPEEDASRTAGCKV